MVTVASDQDAVRRLNHVEMVYRPGERELATRVFELFGMRVLDNGGTWMFAHVDPAIGDAANNACYASEMTPEQWVLEQALADRDQSRRATMPLASGRERPGTSPACAASRNVRSTSGSGCSSATTSTPPSIAFGTRRPIPNSPDGSSSSACTTPTSPARWRRG